MKSPYQFDPRNIQSTSDLKIRIDIAQAEVIAAFDSLKQDLKNVESLKHHQELVKEWKQL